MSQATTLNRRACPHCKQEMKLEEGVFFWRGQFASGWVCQNLDCMALEAIAGQEIPPLKGTGI